MGACARPFRAGALELSPALAAAALALLGGCSPPVPEGPNVALVVVDTLRADRLSCYGYERPTSPTADALAAAGVRFERAYSSAPWTMPSVASMMTGLHPSSHGVTGFVGLPPELPTLAGRMARAGYRTGAVTSHWLVGREFGFERGFDDFRECQVGGHEGVSTPFVLDLAGEVLDGFEEQPFFLWLHLFDPHYEYRRHPEFGFAPVRAGRLTGEERFNHVRFELAPLSPPERALLEALYDEEVRYTDQGLARFLEQLEERGLREDTLILFTGDHGEEFGDHGWLGHVRTLYDDLVRVPLIAAGPGVAAGGVVERPVSLVGLTPTVLEAVGASEGAAGAAWQEGSLWSWMAGPGADTPAFGAAPPVFFEVDMRQGDARTDASKQGLFDGRFKLVHDLRDGGWELYDLEADPRELEDLAAAEPGRLGDLRRTLAEHHRRLAGRRHEGVPKALGAGEESVLSNLGYTGD